MLEMKTPLVTTETLPSVSPAPPPPHSKFERQIGFIQLCSDCAQWLELFRIVLTPTYRYDEGG